MKRRLALALAIGALMGALLPGIATATLSDAKASCKNGGWQALVREDGPLFKNQGACVSYAAQGGMLPSDPFRALCEALPEAVYTRTSAVGLTFSTCETNLDPGLGYPFYDTQWYPVCSAQPGYGGSARGGGGNVWVDCVVETVPV